MITNIEFDSTEYAPGDTITGRMTIKEDYAVASVSLSLEIEKYPESVRFYDYPTTPLKHDGKGNVVYEFSLELPDDVPGTQAKINVVNVEDIAGNNGSFDYDDPLRNIVLTINGPSVPDHDAPVLVEEGSGIGSNEYRPGDTLTGQIIIEDDSDIHSASINYYKLTGGGFDNYDADYQIGAPAGFYDGTVSKNADGNWVFDFSIDISEFQPNAVYRLLSIYVTDIYNNTLNYGIDYDEGQSAFADSLAFDVVDSPYTDMDDPELINVDVERNDYQPGDDVRGTVTLRDVSEIIYGSLTFEPKNDDTGFWHSAELTDRRLAENGD